MKIKQKGEKNLKEDKKRKIEWDKLFFVQIYSKI